MLSFSSVPAIELLYWQRLRRNYGSAIKPGFCGVVPVETVSVRFYRITCPDQGFLPFSVQQLQEAAIITPLEASWHCVSG